MIIILRFKCLCLGKPPTAGGETRQIDLCDQGGGLLFNGAPLALCWEVANCRQQALIMFVVDATFLFWTLHHIVFVYMWLKPIRI